MDRETARALIHDSAEIGRIKNGSDYGRDVIILRDGMLGKPPYTLIVVNPNDEPNRPWDDDCIVLKPNQVQELIRILKDAN